MEETLGIKKLKARLPNMSGEELEEELRKEQKSYKSSDDHINSGIYRPCDEFGGTYGLGLRSARSCRNHSKNAMKLIEQEIIERKKG